MKEIISISERSPTLKKTGKDSLEHSEKATIKETSRETCLMEKESIIRLREGTLRLLIGCKEKLALI